MVYPDSIVLSPRPRACGEVVLPGSKSISNRMLLLAALADGVTDLGNVLDSDDTQVMIESLRALGVSIIPLPHDAADTGSVRGSRLRIAGIGLRFPCHGSVSDPIRLFVGNSGLTVRTLLPAVVASFAATGGCADIHGVPRMHERPIGDLVDGLLALGADIQYLGNPGYPPLRVTGRPLSGGALIRVRGDTSSQFLTGLLQAAPIIGRQSGAAVDIEVDGELISQPYVEITMSVMRRFGVAVERVSCSPLRYRVPARAYSAPGMLQVEGDASSASYFLAAGAIGGGPVRVIGVGTSSVQGDVRLADALARMGATVRRGPDWMETSFALEGGPAPGSKPHHLQGIDIDCNDMPDAAMTLVACALFADGPTTLRGIGSWRVKETDRIAAMAAEASRLGADVSTGSDWLRIVPPAVLRSADITTYDDHRVAMTFALASFGNASVRILDPACVAKTYPGFFEDFSDISAQAVPVLTIDGPTASGKGTIASRVAMDLGFGYLDSGAMYRISALAARDAGLDPADEAALASLAADMDLAFLGQAILLNGADITDAIRAEEIGLLASRIAVHPALRRALLLRQRDFARFPGLVADGRDMGSVVFPKARLKVFLTATARARAERRYKQLIDKGFSCNLDDLSADLEERDARDASRAVAPLKPAAGSVVMDSTDLSIDEVVQAVVNAWHAVSVKLSGRHT
jgi:3-phosphoshikimate 1-carboxyvinyltransferase